MWGFTACCSPQAIFRLIHAFRHLLGILPASATRPPVINGTGGNPNSPSLQDECLGGAIFCSEVSCFSCHAGDVLHNGQFDVCDPADCEFTICIVSYKPPAPPATDKKGKGSKPGGSGQP